MGTVRTGWTADTTLNGSSAIGAGGARTKPRSEYADQVPPSLSNWPSGLYGFASNAGADDGPCATADLYVRSGWWRTGAGAGPTGGSSRDIGAVTSRFYGAAGSRRSGSDKGMAPPACAARESASLGQ